MISLSNDTKEKVFRNAVNSEKSKQELIEECIESGIPVTGHEDVETLEMFLNSSDYDDDDDFDDEEDDNIDDEDEPDEEDDSSEIEPEDEDEIYDDDFDFEEDEEEDLFDDEEDDVQYN